VPMHGCRIVEQPVATGSCSANGCNGVARWRLRLSKERRFSFKIKKKKLKTLTKLTNNAEEKMNIEDRCGGGAMTLRLRF
jgi:hypothetical protein